jgi:hypothetical protein
MSPKVRDAFLNALVQDVRLNLKVAGLEVKGPNVPIERPGELQKKFWPKADILIVNAKSGTEFIIEYDENSDAGRSITKYWPYIDKYNSKQIIYIGVWKWKRGGAFGEGFFKLARFIGEEKFTKLYPSFSCRFIERRTETVQEIACKIQEIVQARKDF